MWIWSCLHSCLPICTCLKTCSFLCSLTICSCECPRKHICAYVRYYLKKVPICKFPHAYQFVPSCGNACISNCIWQFNAMKIELFCHNYHNAWRISIQRDFQMTNMNDDKSKFKFNIEHENQDKNTKYVKCRFKWNFMSRMRQRYNLKKIIWIQQTTKSTTNKN
jgi:hypothetical protein